MGNHMNAASFRGNAYGFQLDALLKVCFDCMSINTLKRVWGTKLIFLSFCWVDPRYERSRLGEARVQHTAPLSCQVDSSQGPFAPSVPRRSAASGSSRQNFGPNSDEHRQQFCCGHESDPRRDSCPSTHPHLPAKRPV